MIAEGVAEAFHLQALLSPSLGSPLYAALLEFAVDDLKRGGVVADLVDGWRGNAAADALPLRLLGAVHRLVLDGRAPPLTPYYPSVGGTPRWPQTWDAFVDVARGHRDFIRARLTKQLQTNEVGRAAALLGGFLRIAQRTGLPLRLLEVGSSAGLNLCWDRYRYDLGSYQWGDRNSPVRIRSHWHEAPELSAVPVRIESRLGCDLHPVDVRDRDQTRDLESFVWPDQLERLAQLRAAIELVRSAPPCIVRGAAAPWLREQLGSAPRDVATVVFHSVIWWYLSEGERDAVTRSIEERGERSTARAPLAWLQLELRDRERAEMSLRLWPQGTEERLAVCHPHGSEVWWAARTDRDDP